MTTRIHPGGDREKTADMRGGKVQKAIRCAVFLAGIIAAVILLGKVLRVRNGEYLSPEASRLKADSADVLFLGPSTIMNGVYPLNLWHDFGITAFNCGSGSQSLMASYYLLEDILARMKPKLVVLDCGKARSARAIVKSGYLHYITDMLPIINSSRFTMIDKSAKDRAYSFDTVAGLIFPCFAYHDRWQHIKRGDLAPDVKLITLGAKVDPRVWNVTDPYAAHEADPDYVLPEMAETYLRKIIETCREEGIDLLMVTMPNMTPAVDVDQEEYELRVDAAAAVQKIADEYGVIHENQITEGENIGLIPGADVADGQHLNYVGAGKYTAWIGNYIKEHYSVPDHRGESGYEEMDRKYKEFRKYLETMGSA